MSFLYYAFRSLTFSASQLASLILGDERNQVTYKTTYLPMSTLVEWIRNGSKFVDSQSEIMTVVSTTDGLSASNSSFDYLYRDVKLANLCSYAFFSFYVKVTVRSFERGDNCHLPRFQFQFPHPQRDTHCLMRLKQPRVPITNGRAIRIPQCWTERSLEIDIHSDEELQSLNEFALYVLARYYPLIAGKGIELPNGLTMYLRVKRWWIEEILPNRKYNLCSYICFKSTLNIIEIAFNF